VFSVSNVYFFADVIGGVVMLLAFSKLGWYQKNFLRALWTDVVYMLLCLTRAVLSFFGMLESGSLWANVLSVAVMLASLLLHVFLLAGIYHLANQVELEKEPKRARRNLILILTYYPVYIIAFLTAQIFGETFSHIASIILLIYGAAVIVLNALLIHSCYCRICESDTLTAPRKPSRFAWLDRWNEKADSLLEGAYGRRAAGAKTDGEPAEPGRQRVKRKKKKGRK
jgi:hypothetical protein